MSDPAIALRGHPALPTERHTSSSGILGALPRWEVVIVTAWFVVFTALAELFPRGGDDWAWGTSEGVDRLKVFFSGINGRYAGDLAILALTRSHWVAAFVVSAVVVASLVLVVAISENRTPLGYGVVGTLFLLMPLAVWRQSVAWLSGFANYSIAALFLLCFIAIARGDRIRPPTRVPRRTLVLLAVAGFVGQLFMETVTLCVFVLGLAFCWLYRRRHRRWPTRTAVWTGAAFVGLVVMFSNSAYRHAVSGTPEYQSVQPGSLKAYAIRLFDYIPTQGVVANLVLNAVLAVSVVGLVVLSRRPRSGARAAVAGARRTAGGFAAVFLAVAVTLWVIERHHQLSDSERGLATVAVVLLAGCLVTTAVGLVASPGRRWAVLTAVAAAVLLAGPLLVVNPVGPRCFYPTYLVLLVAASALVGEIRERLPAPRVRLVALPAHAVGVVVVVVMFLVYGAIAGGVNSRLREVRTAVAAGASVVYIRPLPHSDWVHDANPYWSLLVQRYKHYYGIDSPIAIVLKPNPWLRTRTDPHPPPAP